MSTGRIHPQCGKRTDEQEVKILLSTGRARRRSLGEPKKKNRKRDAASAARSKLRPNTSKGSRK